MEREGGREGGREKEQVRAKGSENTAQAKIRHTGCSSSRIEGRMWLRQEEKGGGPGYLGFHT